MSENNYTNRIPKGNHVELRVVLCPKINRITKLMSRIPIMFFYYIVRYYV